jgi:hypothetical protein
MTTYPGIIPFLLLVMVSTSAIGSLGGGKVRAYSGFDLRAMNTKQACEVKYEHYAKQTGLTIHKCASKTRVKEKCKRSDYKTWAEMIKKCTTSKGWRNRAAPTGPICKSVKACCEKQNNYCIKAK